MFRSESKIVKTDLTLVTDSAGLCIFDPARLKHRLNDRIAWWTIPEQLLEELNNGNLILVDLGSDGYYDITLNEELAQVAQPNVSARLACISGKLFIGPAEYITCEGLEPEDNMDGTFLFLSLVPGTYEIDVARIASFRLNILLGRVEKTAQNFFTEGLQLSDL